MHRHDFPHMHHMRHMHFGHRGFGFRPMFFPFGLLMIPVAIVGFFLFIGLLKLMFPLLLIGGVIFLFSRAFRNHRGDNLPSEMRWGQWKACGQTFVSSDWDDKPKRTEDGEKPKRNERRFTQTADGNWVEII